MSGRDRCYALPELQQWDSAQVDHYVWGAPGTVDTYGKALDTAGGDLASVADSLAGMDVSGFWTGDAATAFTGLRDRVTPAVRGLATMQKEAATALGTWQRHLAVYQEDCGTAIGTGRQGWHLYQATSCDNADAQTKMTQGKNGITTATSSRDSGARICKTALETAATKADGPAQPPGNPATGAPEPGSTAPSGRTPVAFTGPIPAGQPRPYVDPANGRVVVPMIGPVMPGQPRPWVYADGGPTTPAPSTTSTQPVPPLFTTPGQVGTAPSGQEPVPFTGPIADGQPRPYVDPADGRVVVPRPGPWAPGRQPWDYATP